MYGIRIRFVMKMLTSINDEECVSFNNVGSQRTRHRYAVVSLRFCEFNM